MRYDSFLLRYWRRGNEQRIEVAHLQSGERTRTATLVAATDWIGARSDEMSEGGASTGPPATDKEVQVGKMSLIDEEPSRKIGPSIAPDCPE